MSGSAAIALAGLCLILGIFSVRAEARWASHGYFWGLVVAGIASSAVAVLQVVAPAQADLPLLVTNSLPGRAVGNLRQPNHLATMLLLSGAAVVTLADLGGWRRRVAYPLLAAIVLGITLAASRTGYLGIAILALWGLVDRRLAGRSRVMLAFTPAMLAAWWAAAQVWASRSSTVFAGAARLHEADISASRFGIWRDTLELVAAHPWTGVGFGRFNLAWTMTPFPDRPRAFFDHAHNLPLHLIAELGLPLGLLLCGLLIATLWRGGRRAWRAHDAASVTARGLFVMVVMVAIHSLLEYPLWYAHFLLPTAFALGVCLGWSCAASSAPGATRAAAKWSPSGAVLATSGALALVGSAVASMDYLRVSAIFETRTAQTPIEQRIAAGRRSLFFAHHADYARATTAAHPGEVMDSIDIAKYNLLDTRLMLAWARAYAERGDLDKARYVADRLREFRNPASREFFAACEGDPQPRPFQCDPPSRAFTWRDFAGKQ